MVAMVLHTPSGARRRSERPLTIARAPPLPVGCEGSDRLIAELLVEGLAGEDEQAVAPGGHKHHWSRHDGILSATNCDDGSKLLLTNRQVYLHGSAAERGGLPRNGQGHAALQACRITPTLRRQILPVAYLGAGRHDRWRTSPSDPIRKSSGTSRSKERL